MSITQADANLGNTMLEAYNIHEVLELAEICKRIYIGPVNQKILTFGNKELVNQKIVHGSYGRGYCRLLWNDESIIFAFRGSRESIDWLISNCNMFPGRLTGCDNTNEKFLVHNGFQNALYFIDKTTKLVSIESIYKHITDLELLKGRKVIITGHSLGAALALLFFPKLYTKFSFLQNQTTRLILFGCPAVGSKSFESYFNSLNQNTIRVVNGSDIVPFLPPIFYHHVGNEVWIKDKSLTAEVNVRSRLLFGLKAPPTRFVTDHFIKNYVNSIEEIVSK